MREDITQDPLYDIRYTRLLDKTPLKEWLMHPNVLKWFPMNDEKEIDLLVRNWIGYSRFLSSLTAVFDHKPIGVATLFLMPYRKVSHLAMVNIVVAPHMQRKGVGTSLVRNLVHLAKETFKLHSIHMEMIEGCPLIPVLKRQNFYEVFKQERYFEVHKERKARVVMEAKLAGE